MDLPTQDELVESIDAFLKRHPEIGEARFGRDATGEPGLVKRIRNGSPPTLKILWRIKDYMVRKDAELEAGADIATVAGDAAAPDSGEDPPPFLNPPLRHRRTAPGSLTNLMSANEVPQKGQPNFAPDESNCAISRALSSTSTTGSSVCSASSTTSDLAAAGAGAVEEADGDHDIVDSIGCETTSHGKAGEISAQAVIA